jgi:hypothetical protein
LPCSRSSCNFVPGIAPNIVACSLQHQMSAVYVLILLGIKITSSHFFRTPYPPTPTPTHGGTPGSFSLESSGWEERPSPSNFDEFAHWLADCDAVCLPSRLVVRHRYLEPSK